jgi:proline dehydrogenase
LHHSEQVANHIRQYFLRPGLEIPAVIKAAFSVAASGFGSKLAAGTIKKNVAGMASTFITGQDSESAQKTLEKLWNSKECFTVDILGEAALSEVEALHYQARYLELIQGLATLVKAWKDQPQLEEAPWGRVPRANVSVKCSSLFSQADNLDFQGSINAIKDRLRPLLREAMRLGVFVNLDMEQNDLRPMTLTLAGAEHRKFKRPLQARQALGKPDTTAWFGPCAPIDSLKRHLEPRPDTSRAASHARAPRFTRGLRPSAGTATLVARSAVPAAGHARQPRHAFGGCGARLSRAQCA